MSTGSGSSTRPLRPGERIGGNTLNPSQPSLWDSTIELGWDFYNEIIHHPIPFDMNTLTALKRCSLGLDLYLWLTYRTFALRAPQPITWRQVYRPRQTHRP